MTKKTFSNILEQIEELQREVGRASCGHGVDKFNKSEDALKDTLKSVRAAAKAMEDDGILETDEK